MWFEQLEFLPINGWKLWDDGAVNAKDFSISRSTRILQPQDIHQFVFTLVPDVIPLLPLVYAPGSVIPLGRLDISWRSLMGEPGRLLTSVCHHLSSELPYSIVPRSSLDACRPRRIQFLQLYLLTYNIGPIRLSLDRPHLLFYRPPLLHH